MSDWTTLADEAKSHASGPGPKCQVKRVLLSLNDADAEEFQRVLADRVGVSNTGLAKALRARLGVSAPSLFSIGNHRRGNCRCGE